MLVACRLAGLSALETYYVRVRVGAQCRGRMYGRLKLRASAQPPPGSWFLGRGGRQGDEGEGRESPYASRDLEKMFLHIAPSGISIDHDVKYGRLGWWDCTYDPFST